MSPNLTKKQLKTLKNALGKQGMTLEDHENAEKSDVRCEIVKIDGFSLKKEESGQDSEGWYLGYGVQYNGVGVSEAVVESSASSDEEVNLPEDLENRAVSEESSGFDSDPPSDIDQPPVLMPNYDIRRESDDMSDKGQLLYGVGEENGQESRLYLDKRFLPVNVTLIMGNERKEFKTADFIGTNRFEVPKCKESDDEVPEGYQMIPGGPTACTTSEGESDAEEEDVRSKSPTYPPNSTSSSGLWCNFLISPPNLSENLGISEEKLKSIPLDQEKLAQISAAMANFKLPTPPGWEGVSDEKLLDFVRNRV